MGVGWRRSATHHSCDGVVVALVEGQLLVHELAVGRARHGQVGTVDKRDAVHGGEDGDQVQVDLAHDATDLLRVEALVDVGVGADVPRLLELILHVPVLDILDRLLLRVDAGARVRVGYLLLGRRHGCGQAGPVGCGADILLPALLCTDNYALC